MHHFMRQVFQHFIFWTGKHDDYHKPSDDAEKINFRAESQIISFIEALIFLIDPMGKVNFHLREN